MNASDFDIARHLDEAERYLFWRMDEATILIAPLVVGLLAGQFLLGLILGPILLVGLKRLKGKYGEKALHHAFYWFCHPPWGHGLKATPASYVREYLG